ncbi:HIT-like protein [Pluteus cervinus]|uniref:HIT-like protein n=1 Tax=Pluteus cervinus TaxID=181527 RepID=A0ACD3BFA6_9AGAR|nr:HIT-like protein [Pluteus cervinus]
MSNLTVLRTYATTDPAKIPASVLFNHTEDTLVIYDAYPKSTFHFLVLPRVRGSLTTNALSDLRTLLKGDKGVAKEVISKLAEAAAVLKDEIESEMVKCHGFKWGIWLGFHGNPSMEHLHLHVLSDDLCSERMKNKKHYNSFHPKLGFFIHIEEVQSWFDAEPSYYDSMVQRERKTFEPLLKEGLECWRCGKEMKNIPVLKAHLQEEHDREAKRRKLRGTKRKARAEEPAVSPKDDEAQPQKRQKSETNDGDAPEA